VGFFSPVTGLFSSNSGKQAAINRGNGANKTREEGQTEPRLQFGKAEVERRSWIFIDDWDIDNPFIALLTIFLIQFIHV
jgi:hypothetical protein